MKRQADKWADREGERSREGERERGERETVGQTVNWERSVKRMQIK